MQISTIDDCKVFLYQLLRFIIDIKKPSGAASERQRPVNLFCARAKSLIMESKMPFKHDITASHYAREYLTKFSH
jgi:hypothetical protein